MVSPSNGVGVLKVSFSLERALHSLAHTYHDGVTISGEVFFLGSLEWGIFNGQPVVFWFNMLNLFFVSSTTNFTLNAGALLYPKLRQQINARHRVSRRDHSLSVFSGTF